MSNPENLTPFKKGDKRNTGRPKGSKDVKWKSLQFWFDQLETELNRKLHIRESDKAGTLIREYDTYAVDPNTRARIFLDAMKMLVSKMQEIPKDPTESNANASKLLAEIKALETQFDPSRDQKSDKNSLDNRPPKI